MAQDPEIAALAQVTDIVHKLDDAARSRVLKYLFEKYGLVAGEAPVAMSAPAQAPAAALKAKPSESTASATTTTRKRGPGRPKKGKPGPKPKKDSKFKQSLNKVDEVLQIPNVKEELKALEKETKPSTSYDYNLLLVHFLSNIKGMSGITKDHIYTCLDMLGGKIPANLYQSVHDTGKTKGWLDTTDMKDLKVTQAGVDHLNEMKANA